jgi:hypothetical protein
MNPLSIATQENAPAGLLTCYLCGWTAHCAAKLLAHVTGKHGHARPFCCITCGSKYKWKEALAAHRASAHRAGGAATFPCPSEACPYAATSRSNLQTHVRQRHQLDRPHACAFAGCGFAAIYQSKLLAHQTRMGHQ